MPALSATTIDLLVVLVLILAANGCPIIARHWLGDRFATPIDLGTTLGDGQPFLGASKTWRGLIASLLCTSLVGLILFVPLNISLTIASLAMLGDLLSSFVKRRVGIKPSGMLTGVDQIPESLLPALSVAPYFDFSAAQVVLIVLGFFVLNRWLSVVLYKMNIRRRPF
ncbi:MAG: CDP-archaeol synthase [bacterium]